ncbi:hypothetical protein ABT075_30670 [Streptomyces sp. NPDC002677]|uniref:hypothetical protein n=1 Tax=Streptomyces sp. NPDC002677 TaxID=3154774 RepID=UPI00332EC7FD
MGQLRVQKLVDEPLPDVRAVFVGPLQPGVLRLVVAAENDGLLHPPDHRRQIVACGQHPDGRKVVVPVLRVGDLCPVASQGVEDVLPAVQELVGKQQFHQIGVAHTAQPGEVRGRAAHPDLLDTGVVEPQGPAARRGQDQPGQLASDDACVHVLNLGQVEFVREHGVVYVRARHTARLLDHGSPQGAEVGGRDGGLDLLLRALDSGREVSDGAGDPPLSGRGDDPRDGGGPPRGLLEHPLEHGGVSLQEIAARGAGQELVEEQLVLETET